MLVFISKVSEDFPRLLSVLREVRGVAADDFQSFELSSPIDTALSRFCRIN